MNIAIDIDDLPANCAVVARGVGAILFTSKVNRDAETDFPWVSGWAEAVERIAEIDRVSR